MDVSRKLPVPMTADGFPVGIGDIVFIIWNEMRKNKCGRYYASRNLVVYPVNITSLTFERDYKEGDIYWTGDCVTLTDLDGVQASFGCRMGKYNAFSTEEAAKDSMKSGYWDSGIANLPYAPPMPYDLWRSRKKEVGENE